MISFYLYRNCRSHRRRQLMMPFFNWNWGRACKGRWVGSGLLAGWDAGSQIVWAEGSRRSTPLLKQGRWGGRRGLRPWSLRCLTQILSERKERLPRGRMCCICLHKSLHARVCTFHRWGGHVFIVDVQPVR